MTYATIHPVAAHVMSLVKSAAAVSARCLNRRRHDLWIKYVDAGAVQDTADYSLRTGRMVRARGLNCKQGTALLTSRHVQAFENMELAGLCGRSEIYAWLQIKEKLP